MRKLKVVRVEMLFSIGQIYAVISGGCRFDSPDFRYKPIYRQIFKFTILREDWVWGSEAVPWTKFLIGFIAKSVVQAS